MTKGTAEATRDPSYEERHAHISEMGNNPILPPTLSIIPATYTCVSSCALLPCLVTVVTAPHAHHRLPFPSFAGALAPPSSKCRPAHAKSIEMHRWLFEIAAALL